jgi:Spy/CpxP family protein refolding chaperone
MKRILIAAATAALLVASASSQPYGGGPGMMGGYGGGFGPGASAGMMGGYGGGGYGPGGYGPGMMGGSGYGPGMMGGGPGAGNCAAGGGLNLSADQQAKLSALHAELAPKQWALMQKMRELDWRSEGGPGARFDEQAARKAYDAMADVRKQMFELSMENHKRVDAVLTPQQREQWRRGWGG